MTLLQIVTKLQPDSVAHLKKMKDNLGNNVTKTLASCAIAFSTIPIFIATSVAGARLGDFSSYLPLIILGSSSLSITSIWLFGRPRKVESASIKKLAQLEQRIEELEQRISNAEVIDSFENRLAAKEVQQRAEKSYTSPVENSLSS